MLMAVLTRRLQVLLDERRFTRLETLAAERHTTIAALVREALDEVFPSGSLPPKEAAERFLARPPEHLGEWDDLKSEIEASLTRGR